MHNGSKEGVAGSTAQSHCGTPGRGDGTARRSVAYLARGSRRLFSAFVMESSEGQEMTDPTGRSFLSYRRTRLDEARLLIEAQHDVGIPTWQDLSELDEGHTDALLRETLEA